MTIKLRTVVETPTYLQSCKSVFDEDERTGIVTMVARDPTVGQALGGGLRKVRVGLKGRGKRGGGRVVFLFAGDDLPVFLLAAFAKSDKANLTPQEQAVLVAAAKGIVKKYRSQR